MKRRSQEILYASLTTSLALALGAAGCTASSKTEVLAETTVTVPAADPETGLTPAKSAILAVCKASQELTNRNEFSNLSNPSSREIDDTCNDAARELLSRLDGPDLSRQELTVQVVSGGWPWPDTRIHAFTREEAEAKR